MEDFPIDRNGRRWDQIVTPRISQNSGTIDGNRSREDESSQVKSRRGGGGEREWQQASRFLDRSERGGRELGRVGSAFWRSGRGRGGRKHPWPPTRWPSAGAPPGRRPSSLPQRPPFPTAAALAMPPRQPSSAIYGRADAAADNWGGGRQHVAPALWRALSRGAPPHPLSENSGAKGCDTQVKRATLSRSRRCAMT